MASETIAFPKGLIGFEQAIDFSLNWDQARAPFHMLAAAECSFVLMPICEFAPDFQVVPTAEEEQSLSLEDADELMLFAIVTIPKDPAQMSANLQGPLLINFSKKLGLQVVRPDGELRYPLLEGYKQCLLRERQKC